MKDPNCLFCKIVAGEEPSEKIWENDEFVCIRNKYPVAPTHVLVIPKAHIVKATWIAPLRSPTSPSATLGVKLRGAKLDVSTGQFWGKIMSAVFEVVAQLGLDKTTPTGGQAGYKLVNNGAGYNHFEHEHVHVMGGSKTEPGGNT